jgi:hypothetical protein
MVRNTTENQTWYKFQVLTIIASKAAQFNMGYNGKLQAFTSCLTFTKNSEISH